MAYMCQSCSQEGDLWPGECPNCKGKQFLTLAKKKDTMIGQVIDGRYRVVEQLGQGGMGTVYKAIREGMGQTLAIKVLNPQFSNEPEVVRRFLREAKSYGMVQHPNAVNLLDFGQTPDEALYIAMEFISGKDLAKTIQEKGKLSLLDAVDICIQCCDVLGYAHEKGIIHRDLKPENIMLVKGLRSYHAKVLDFGIARLISDNSTQLTVAGTICGTPRYMSPEQARGKEVDVRSDIYSLGLVLFEMVTGRQAYTHSAVTELLRAQVTEPVPHIYEVEGLTNIPPALDEVIQKASAKKRDDRYISMGQLADALSKALPTQQDMQAFSGTSPRIEPGGPGRTYLGPGAGGGPDGVPSLNTPSDPNGTGQNLPQQTPSGLPAVSGDSRPAIPASELGRPKAPTPARTSPSEGTNETLLKPKSSPGIPALGSNRVSSESLQLAAERPEPARPARNLVPVIIVGGLVLAGAIAAGVILPKMNAPPPPMPDPVAVAPTPAPASGPATPGPAPAPVAPTPATPGAVATSTPAAGTASSVAKMVAEETAHNSLIMAKNSFIDGQLDGAVEHLRTITPSSRWSGDAKELESEVDLTKRLLERANGKRSSGDCEGAINLYNQALSHSHGLHEASSGIAACKKSAIPTELGGY